MVSRGDIAGRDGDPFQPPSVTAIMRQRDKPPKDWRYFVGGLGRVLIALGLLVLGFVAYQLWGTNIQEARSQNKLEDQFQQLLETAPVTPTTTVTTAAPGSTTAPPPPTTAAPATTPTTLGPTMATYELGQPVARLEIPKIGLDKIVIAGVRTSDLKQGPGHYPGTPLPGEHGNAAIAGHRTTYGAPFSRIDELNPGDKIITITVAGTFAYTVTDRFVIDPQQTEVLANSPNDVLTLTSCHPRYSTKQRIVVRAALDPTQSAPVRPATDTNPTGAEQVPLDTLPPDTVAPGETTVVPATTTPGVTTPATTAATGLQSSVDTYTAGWLDDPAAWPQVIFWALALVGIGVLAGWLGRRTNRIIGFFVGLVPFVVALYFFYENLARLLPPNL